MIPCYCAQSDGILKRVLSIDLSYSRSVAGLCQCSSCAPTDDVLCPITDVQLSACALYHCCDVKTFDSPPMMLLVPIVSAIDEQHITSNGRCNAALPHHDVPTLVCYKRPHPEDNHG
jgi:hypothetical protein